MSIPFPIRRNLTVKVSDFDLAGNIDGLVGHLRTPVCYTDITDSVENVHFQNFMPGGFGGATLTIHSTPTFDVSALSPGSRVIISDRGRTIYEGRIEDPGVTFSGTKSSISVLCAGHVARLKDDQAFRRVFIDAGIDNWVLDNQLENDYFDGQDRTTDFEKFDIVPIQSDDGTSANDKIMFAIVKGADYNHGDSCRAYYWILNGMRGRSNLLDISETTELVRKVSFTVTMYLGTSWKLQLYTRRNPATHTAITGDPDRVLWSQVGSGYAAGTLTYTKSITLRDDDEARALVFRLVTDDTDGTTPAYNFKVKISNLKVYGTTAYTATPHAIVGNLVSELYANYVYDKVLKPDATADLALDHFVYPDFTDRATIIEEMNSAIGWDWGVWDNETFYYLDPDGAGRKTGENLYVASLSDSNVKWDIKLDYSDVVTEVVARRIRHKKFGDVVQEYIYPTNVADIDIDTDPEWGESGSTTRSTLGFVRRRVLDLTMGGRDMRTGVAITKRIAKRYVAEHSKPVWVGTIDVSGPIQTAAGTWVPPWWIRAGQYIECTNMGYEYDRKMRILSVDVDLAAGTARLEVGRMNTSRVDRFLAMMQMKNRPSKGWTRLWERMF